MRVFLPWGGLEWSCQKASDPPPLLSPSPPPPRFVLNDVAHANKDGVRRRRGRKRKRGKSQGRKKGKGDLRLLFAIDSRHHCLDGGATVAQKMSDFFPTLHCQTLIELLTHAWPMDGGEEAFFYFFFCGSSCCDDAHHRQQNLHGCGEDFCLVLFRHFSTEA